MNNNNQLIYLACPYSHDDPSVRNKRYSKVTKVAAALVKTGHCVFSPITLYHPMTELEDLPKDWAFWEKMDRSYLSISKALFVLRLDGWKGSVGLQAEIKIAQDMGIPVEYIDE